MNNPSIIMLCGKDRVACESLTYLLHLLCLHELRIEVVVCPNECDKGYDTWQPSLSKAAARLGVRRIDVGEVKSEKNLLLVSLEYDRILPVQEFASERLFNIHFSLLPKYRGVYTAIWPILNGESVSGVTLHRIDSGIDSGDIVAQHAFELPDSFTARDLFEQYHREAAKLFRSQILSLIKGDIHLVKQAEGEASFYNRKSIDFSVAGILDFREPAEAVIRRTRAFYFPEYQLPIYNGRAVRAWTIVEGCQTNASPETELNANTLSGVYAAGDGKAVQLVWA